MINCKSLMVKTLTNNAFFLSLVGTASLEVTTVLDSRILNITLKVKKKNPDQNLRFLMIKINRSDIQ